VWRQGAPLQTWWEGGRSEEEVEEEEEEEEEEDEEVLAQYSSCTGVISGATQRTSRALVPWAPQVALHCRGGDGRTDHRCRFETL